MSKNDETHPENPEDKLSGAIPLVNEGELTGSLPEKSGEDVADAIDAPEPKKRGRPPGSKSGARSHKANPTRARNKANAETVVGTLDMMRNALSNGTCPADDDKRKSCLQVWERYFEETGMEPPLWVALVFVSGSYLMPALATEPARGKMSGLVENLKAWIQKRRAKKANS